MHDSCLTQITERHLLSLRTQPYGCSRSKSTNSKTLQQLVLATLTRNEAGLKYRKYLNSHYNIHPSRNEMLRSIVSLFFAAVMWVQVPQWSNDWSKCAVDVPDTACHWYVVAPDNTFGEGFSWANAPWFSAEGLLDIGELTDTMNNIHLGAVENA